MLGAVNKPQNLVTQNSKTIFSIYLRFCRQAIRFHKLH